MPEMDPFIETIQEWLEVFMRRSMHNLIRYSRESGLSMSQLGALYHLQRRGSSGVTDLAEHLGVTMGAASQLLDRLEQQTLIERSEDPNDRRGKHIYLTEQGRQIMQASLDARQGWLAELAKGLSEPEQEQIAAALKILIDQARKPGQTLDPNF